MPYGSVEYSMKPVFIDQLAVDFVVTERRHMKLTTGERRHAAHRLNNMGMRHETIAEVLHVTRRTVERMLSYSPPPILDVDDEGQYVTVAG